MKVNPLPPYEAGLAPCCDSCDGIRRFGCEITALGCSVLESGNSWMAIASEIAAIVARNHDEAKREAIAHGIASVFDQELGGAIEYDAFVAACCVHDRAVA